MEPLKLLCLPYAGASALVYARWRRRLPSFVDATPVELPGRGTRSEEPCATDVAELARQLAAELLPTLRHGAPFAIFGHSLGALVGFELAHALRELGRPASALFASASLSPTSREASQRAVPLDDEGLIAELRSYEGTPEAVFESAELLAMTLPVLRADLLLGRGYRPRLRPRFRLRCPIHVFGGTRDEPTSRQLMEWRNEGDAGFTLSMFEGGHFFLREAEDALLAALVSQLAALGREPQARASTF